MSLVGGLLLVLALGMTPILAAQFSRSGSFGKDAKT
jgi:hypothetical protein